MTKVLSIQNPANISRALEHLRSGDVVAFPTDTVYGLGADLWNPHAIKKLFIAKGRDVNKAIAVLIGNPDALSQVTDMKAIATSLYLTLLSECFWPGALTLVLPRHPDLPEILSPLPTIGVRMPDHSGALKLLNASGPLAVTSANLSGESPATTAQGVLEQLGERVDLVLDGGQSPGGQASTVLDCTQEPPIILRQGPISQAEIDRCIHRQVFCG